MAGPRIGSWCSGYRGLDMAVESVFGGTTAWVSDVDPGANRILAHHWPTTPNLGDLTVTDWQTVVDEHGPVDIVCGGYPCQPFSSAGLRKGTEDERHIWPYIADALGVLRPRVAIFENVAGHLRRGFDTVLADLARLGFDVEWACVRASEVGAPHPRQRLFILATAQDADREPWDQRRLTASGEAESRWARPDLGGRGGTPSPDANRRGRGPAESHLRQRQPDAAWGSFLPAIRRWESITGSPAPRAVDARGRLSPLFVEWLMGLPAGWVTDVPGLNSAAQLKALGNGVVPQQAEAAIRLLATRSTADALATAA